MSLHLLLSTAPGNQLGYALKAPYELRHSGFDRRQYRYATATRDPSGYRRAVPILELEREVRLCIRHARPGFDEIEQLDGTRLQNIFTAAAICLVAPCRFPQLHENLLVRFSEKPIACFSGFQQVAMTLTGDVDRIDMIAECSIMQEHNGTLDPHDIGEIERSILKFDRRADATGEEQERADGQKQACAGS
jgi:hypothetical protein